MSILWVTGDRAVGFLRKRLFHNILYREISFFDHHRTGDIISRLTSDTTAVNTALTVELSELLVRFFVVIVAFSYSLYLSWDLTFLTILFMPLISFISTKVSKFFRKIAHEANDELSNANNIAEEGIGCIRTIRSFSQEKSIINRYNYYIDRNIELLQRQKIVKAIQRSFIFVAGSLAMCLVLIYAAIKVASNQLSTGELITFLMFSLQIGEKSGQVVDYFTQLKLATGASQRVFQFIHEGDIELDTRKMKQKIITTQEIVKYWETRVYKSLQLFQSHQQYEGYHHYHHYQQHRSHPQYHLHQLEDNIVPQNRQHTRKTMSCNVHENNERGVISTMPITILKHSIDMVLMWKQALQLLHHQQLRKHREIDKIESKKMKNDEKHEKHEKHEKYGKDEKYRNYEKYVENKLKYVKSKKNKGNTDHRGHLLRSSNKDGDNDNDDDNRNNNIDTGYDDKINILTTRNSFNHNPEKGVPMTRSMSLNVDILPPSTTTATATDTTTTTTTTTITPTFHLRQQLHQTQEYINEKYLENCYLLSKLDNLLFSLYSYQKYSKVSKFSNDNTLEISDDHYHHHTSLSNSKNRSIFNLNFGDNFNSENRDKNIPLKTKPDVRRGKVQSTKTIQKSKSRKISMIGPKAMMNMNVNVNQKIQRKLPKSILSSISSPNPCQRGILRASDTISTSGRVDNRKKEKIYQNTTATMIRHPFDDSNPNKGVYNTVSTSIPYLPHISDLTDITDINLNRNEEKPSHIPPLRSVDSGELTFSDLEVEIDGDGGGVEVDIDGNLEVDPGLEFITSTPEPFISTVESLKSLKSPQTPKSPKSLTLSQKDISYQKSIDKVQIIRQLRTLYRIASLLQCDTIVNNENGNTQTKERIKRFALKGGSEKWMKIDNKEKREGGKEEENEKRKGREKRGKREGEDVDEKNTFYHHNLTNLTNLTTRVISPDEIALDTGVAVVIEIKDKIDMCIDRNISGDRNIDAEVAIDGNNLDNYDIYTDKSIIHTSYHPYSFNSNPISKEEENDEGNKKDKKGKKDEKDEKDANLIYKQQIFPYKPKTTNVHLPIEFSNIWFRYQNRLEKWILRRFSLRIDPGSVVALVGNSGGGKSTIVSLLENFYIPARGKITWGGVDINEFHPDWYHRQIGYVGQEPVLFCRSIRENILFGVSNQDLYTEKDIVNAAKIANAHRFIMNLPQGYNTIVGERGAQLSGGQKQRIAIARAILMDPPILILDEATSALDVESETKVQQALDRLMGRTTIPKVDINNHNFNNNTYNTHNIHSTPISNLQNPQINTTIQYTQNQKQKRTTIVIAHRLSTIRNADKIVVIINGQILEQGSHDELLQNHGYYYDMVQNQLKLR